MMDEKSPETAPPAQLKLCAEKHDSRFWVQALPLLRALNASPQRNKLALMASGLIGVILLNAFAAFGEGDFGNQ